jgi:hypothetical protein
MFDVWHLTLGRRSWIGHPEAEGKLSDAFLMQGIGLFTFVPQHVRHDAQARHASRFSNDVPSPPFAIPPRVVAAICPMMPEVPSQKMKSDQGSFAPGDFWCSESGPAHAGVGGV